MLGFRFSYLYKLHTESFMGFNAVSLPGNPPGAFFRSSLPATPVSTPIRENGRFSEQALRERLCRTPSPRKCRLFESRISEPDIGFNSLQCGLQLSSPDDEINEDMPSVFSPVRPSVESRLENLEHEKENAPMNRLNRRIFVGNIGCKVTKKELQDFFSKFGKVVDCLIVLDHIKKQPRGYGFVIFACQQDAERARNASESDLEFDGRVLKVFPAEEKRTSKHRKEAREMVLQQKIENGDTDNFNQRISRSHSLKNINEMNDDMLLLIFSYLDIKERIKLELVCKKWQNLACILWQSQESLSYQDLFAFWEDYRLTNGILKNILRKSSSRLKRLDLSEVSHMLDYQAVEIIATYCHCLEYVNLSTLKITNVSVQQLAKKCRMIKSLTLQNCLEVGEKGIWWLFHLSKNLEYLDLTGNPRITGQCFHVAGSNLRAIILDDCSRFSAGGFTKLATKCRLLTTLKLNDCNQLTDRALELLCQCLKNLKTFHLGGTFPHLTSSGLHHVGRLNNLEELSLQSNHLVDDDTVYAISRGCRKLRFLDISACYPGISDYSLSSLSPCYNLRTLHISYLNKITDEGLSSISRQGLLEVIECRGCCRVSDQGFLAIVVLCPYLRHLDVSGCHRVTNVTVTACLDTIQARHSKDKLLIIVGGTSVELEALELNDSLLEVSRQNLCCKRFHSMDENSDWFSSEGSSDEGAVGGDGITPLIPSGDYLFGEDPSVDPTILFDNDWSEVHESPL